MFEVSVGLTLKALSLTFDKTWESKKVNELENWEYNKSGRRHRVYDCPPVFVCEHVWAGESEKERPRLPRLLCLQCGGGATAMHQNQGERGCKSEGVGWERERKIEELKDREAKIQKRGNNKRHYQRDEVSTDKTHANLECDGVCVRVTINQLAIHQALAHTADN